MGEKLTPMMQQYRAIKEKYSDCIVLFRLGDFYEMFFEDAVEGSKILGITLTARNKGDGVKAPMCGVPYHAAEKYIGKLTQAGKKVAICDQVTEPNGTGIVERDVTRVVTPGTTQDDSILDEKSNNYVACIVQSYDGFGFSYADVTTGEAFVTEFLSVDEVKDEISRVSPAEIILAEGLVESFRSVLSREARVYFPFEIFTDPSRVLIDSFGMKCLGVFGIEDKKSAILAAATLYEYLKETQKTDLKHLENIRFYTGDDFMPLVATTYKNLEIFYSGNSRGRGRDQSSLFSVIDQTLTSMGGRKLKNWMIHPLNNLGKIQKRISAVEEILKDANLLGNVREILEGVLDIERLLSRLSLGTGSARDLVALKVSLNKVPLLKQKLSGFDSDFFKDVVVDLVDLGKLTSVIEEAIQDEPPAIVREGGMIKDKYNSELDELRSINTEGKGFIAEMQKREIERTGISSLKIKYNKVFGYYIEISKSNLKNVPDDYDRKQTLVNAERFITPELKEYEDKVLRSRDRICELEYELFYSVRMKVVELITDIRRVADAVARIDVVFGFAELALKNNYCKPEVTDGFELEISEGRHPVLERINLAYDFVPNDCVIDPAKNSLNLITGPNMGGKSVYLKQVALIVYLSHIGCFVPAKACRVGLVDQIFTRVGASDNLVAGESTFMVEMVEASTILHNATPRSLVILDEIGRGTSTYDGLSIAWAICEYLHDKIKAKTLFATHYHELISLVGKLERGKNFSVAVSEKAAKHEDGKSDLVFLYRVIPGGTSKSYGIEVAKLAGLPRDVIMKARGILENLEKEIVENSSKVHESQIDIFESREGREEDLSEEDLVAERGHQAIEELKNVDPDNLTPLEALKKFHDLKEKGLI
ncbi:DNA mismatch repair protein MutS [Candidatus Peregrinibacteria bacterium]|jgi:DNA mismatch repair protein MutS|nr:DNA mismatch repair protein MutS [Candidatus Peregrinibacteria bacterium]MBT4148651.1 DNA mismatch repair protein MutS [Candidatus Peregrinibacteria bacterium]MBT4366343.1 DNA mismatch repair protein MutS [Candidatus Peregrinibacteria bacterium]MBT4456018.1 DNA mismatch repair protein MutS [Candidatus Peregrinibacteria bacterium]